MEKTVKILLNNETWKDLEECANRIFFSEKLMIGTDVIMIHFEIGKTTN